MPVNILMPALSPTMEKGNLAKWLKQEGDAIKSGDVIAEIETDKATMEVEAVDEGILARILVPEGTADVPVNQPIGVIAAEGEDPKAAAQSAGQRAPAPSATKPAEEKAATETAAQAAKQSSPQPFETPPAAAPQDEAKKDAKSQSPHPEEARRAVSKDEGAVANGRDRGERIFASPLARRIAKEAGIDLAAIAGSGPHGRVVERDVKAAQAGGTARRAPSPGGAAPARAPLAAGMADADVAKLFEPGSYEEAPHDSMRKIIAQRLQLAKQTIPHFYLTLDCELDALLAAREAINAAAPKDKEGKPAFKVSVNDFVIKALAMALMRVPEANVTWTEGAMLKHRHADVGVAVSIPGGLITPVVRKAETKGLATISREMKDYAGRARNRRLKPEEYQGGTTAVSNLGMFGIKDFAAVINPPHATILAVGAGEKRVVVSDGAPAIATLMTVTLSTDHRAVDGALGAELMAAFKQMIESPAMMLV